MLSAALKRRLGLDRIHGETRRWASCSHEKEERRLKVKRRTPPYNVTDDISFMLGGQPFVSNDRVLRGAQSRIIKVAFQLQSTREAGLQKSFDVLQF